MRSLVIAMMLTMGAGTLLAQIPPIKMGLWEKSMVITRGTGAPTTVKAKSCITSSTWQDMVANALKQRPGCNVESTKTAHGYTFSGTCTQPDSTIVMNGSTSIQDSEHIVAESHSTSTTKGRKNEFSTHATSRYLGANCGSVKPGEPEAEDE